MDRLASIKDGFKMWENRYPLNPPETFTQKLAAQHAEDLAKSFEQLAPNHVGYLLQRLERYETSLKAIVNYDDGLLRVHEEVAELVGIYEQIAKEALKDEAIQP